MGRVRSAGDFGILLLSLSAAGWNGHVRPWPMNYVSLAGLVPHTDAMGFYGDTFRQALWGAWGGTWRPLAEAFRQITVMAGAYSYPGTLLVQAGLVAAALFLAARNLARWYGLWAAIGFVGFIFILVRPFLATTMTEPLGLVITLMSIAFLLDALRLHSLPHALIALAGITAALIVRMGSMFSIPLLVLWITFAFAGETARRLRIFVVACTIVLAIVMLNSLIASLYADHGSVTGGNFMWVACGLSLGRDWWSCPQIYADEFQHFADQHAAVIFLLTKTWQNIVADPSVILLLLVRHALDYVRGIPAFVFNGYGDNMPIHLSADWALLLIGALIISTLAVNYRRWTLAEICFWPLLFVTVVISAAIVFGDDGWRTLFVTHALVACFLATGFAAPVTMITGDTVPTLRWRPAALIAIGIAAVLLIAPATARTLLRLEVGRLLNSATVGKGENVILGGRFVTGFLVVADGTPVLPNVVRFHASDFIYLMHVSAVETEFRLTAQEIRARVPFAFIWAPRLDKPTDQYSIYVAPPVILDRPDVTAWRLRLHDWATARKPVPYIQNAIVAEPLP